MGIVIFRDDDQSGSLFVEAMDDARAQRFVGLRSAAGERLSTSEKRVYEGTSGIPCSGMNAHSRGFVDDEEVVIFIKNFQRDGLRFGAKRRALPRFEDDAFTAAKF